MGHPLHPILITLPLGSSIAGWVFSTLDVLQTNTSLTVAGKDSPFNSIAYYNLLFAIGTGLLAAAPGLWDQLYLPPSRAKRVGWVHGIANVISLVLYGAAVAVQRGQAKQYGGVARGSMTAWFILTAGIGISGFAGFLGGELVNRLGVGVDEKADLNAKLSVTHGSNPSPNDRINLSLNTLFETDHAVREKAGEVKDSIASRTRKQA